MSVITPTENCFHKFRNVIVPRKLFFVLILVQLTLFVLMTVYNTYGLYIKNGRNATESPERYYIKSRTRAVSNSIRTTTSLPNNTTTVHNELAPYVTRRSRPKVTVPKCPLVPPYLQGPVSVDLNEYDEKYLSMKHRYVGKGGVYKPRSCRSRHKVAIIIPYRNRKKHLRIFLNNLHPFLQKQQLDYRIFVIELAPNVDFNRALCMNIGFLEATKKYGYECLIFHDVDLIPENDNNMYSCPENPRHMSVAIDKYDYKLQYMQIFGGVTALTKDQFEMVNGYSNKFFGWGGEDDDLYSRIRNLGVSITRYTPDVSSYRMLKHQMDSNLNTNRFQLVEKGLDRWRKDGLNTIKYEVIQTVQKRLYTYILADIDQDDIAYQPWTMGRGNGSRDDSLDPVVEELLLDKARYLLNRFSLDVDLVDKLKREFRFLNTSDANMQNVAGIIRKLYPAKSPVPMEVPQPIKSSGNNSSIELQTRVNLNGSGSYQYSLLKKNQVTIGHSQTQHDDQKSLQPVQAQHVNKDSFTSGPTRHQNQKIVNHEQENPKQVQTQQDNRNSITQLTTQRENQMPVQSVQTRMENLNPNSSVKVQQENPNSVKSTQTQDRNPSSVKSIQTQDKNPSSVKSIQSQDKNPNSVHFDRAQQELRNSSNSVKSQKENKNAVLFVQAQAQHQNPFNSVPKHLVHAHEENKNYAKSVQKQKESQNPVNFVQSQREIQNSVRYVQRQDTIQNLPNSVKPQLGDLNSEQSIKTQKGNRKPVNSVQIQQEIQMTSNPILTQQENKNRKIQTDMGNEHVHLQQQNETQLKYVQTSNQSQAEQSRAKNVDVGQPMMGNEQFQNFQQFKKRFEVLQENEIKHKEMLIRQAYRSPFNRQYAVQEWNDHLHPQQNYNQRQVHEPVSSLNNNAESKPEVPNNIQTSHIDKQRKNNYISLERKQSPNKSKTRG